MNKAELVSALAERMGGNKKQAGEALEVVIDTIYRAVTKGEKVTITGFGSFEKVERAARTGRNPATGETIRVRKSVAPKFRPGQEFKNVVTGKKKLGRLPKPAAAAAPARAGKAAPAKAAPAKAAATRTTATKTAARKTATTAAKAPAKRATAAKTATKRATTKAAATKATATKATTTKAAAKKTTTRRAAKKA